MIVDDHKLFADAIRPILQFEGIHVAAVSTTGPEAVADAQRTRPHVILLDLGLPDADAIDVGKQILRDVPHVRILALGAVTDPTAVDETEGAGFHGYLTKDAAASQLVASIRGVHSGEHVMLPGVDDPVANGHRAGSRQAEMLAASLSTREREVLALLVEGADTREIAQRLYLSSKTVRTHVQRILAKLGVHSRLQAVAFAVRHRVPPASPNGSTL